MINFLIALITVSFVGALFYFFDKNKEPLRLILRTFIFGIISIPILYLISFMLPTFPRETSLLVWYFFLAFLMPFFLHGFFDFVLMYYVLPIYWIIIPLSLFMWFRIFMMKKRSQGKEIF